MFVFEAGHHLTRKRAKGVRNIRCGGPLLDHFTLSCGSWCRSPPHAKARRARREGAGDGNLTDLASFRTLRV